MLNKQDINRRAKKKIHFEKLTPVDDADISVYEEALNIALSDDHILNIALSGPYGSGKSSIIRTYIRKHSEYKFMQVSLANFKDDAKDDAKDVAKNVESKITNQLVQQIDPEKIPQSGFKIKHYFGGKKIFKFTAFISFFSLSLCTLIFKQEILKYCALSSCKRIRRFGFLLGTSDANIVLVAFLILLCIFLIGWMVKKLGQSLSIHRLKILNSELEIFSNSGESTIFDTEINEIDYLIERAKPDVILFEDIDRFNSIDVIEHIREINFLINSRNEYRKKKNRKIKFLYLIRDDLLRSGKERVKFFDIIIPVVPIIDPSNSYNKLLELVKSNSDLSDKLDLEFLQDVSLYIDDFRLLKNILNEFEIYRSVINIKGLDLNKLFAIIIYKSIFPGDFNQLQFEKGFIYNLFKRKSELENEIEIISKDFENEDIQLEDESSASAKLNELEKNAIPLAKLLKNKEKLDSYFNSNCASLDYKDTNKKDEFSEIKNSEYYPLLKYLIRHGYIDESYHSYLTYYYEEGGSLVDRDFLLSIVNEDPKGYSYELDHPDILVNRLTKYYCSQRAILNYDLFSALIMRRSESKIDGFLGQIVNQLKGMGDFLFILGYFDSGKYDNESFVLVLNEKWPEFFSMISREQDPFYAGFLQHYSLLTLYTAADELLLKIDSDKSLSGYISSRSDYLAIDHPDMQKIVHAFTLLKIKVVEIKEDISNRELLKEIYENSMYELSFMNIEIMMRNFLDADEAHIKHSNYSIVSSYPDSPLSRYVAGNEEKYIAEVLSNCEGKIIDGESAVADILNKKTISSESKCKYIDCLERHSVSCLSNIKEKALWEYLLKHCVIACNEENILNYYLYHNNELSPDFISFIEDSLDGVLNFERISTVDNEATLNDMALSFVTCKGLSSEKYCNIINSFKKPENFTLDGLSEDSAYLLIFELHRVAMNAENLRTARSSFSPDLLAKFIHLFFEDFLGLGSVFREDMLLILDNPLFSLEQQKAAINAAGDYPISIVGKGYHEELLPLIFKSHFSDEDLEDTFSNYKYYPSAAKKYIYDKAVSKFFDATLDDFYGVMSKELIYDIISDQETDELKRIDFTDEISHRLSDDEIVQYLSMFDSKFKGLRARMQFPGNPKYEKLLKIAKSRGLISTYRLGAKGKYTISLTSSKKKC